MARPIQESWDNVKKIARYIMGRGRVVWDLAWQEEQEATHLFTDSDWGGDRKDGISTSGGVWMPGIYCIKTWSATQGAYALSSAEAEFYAIIEGVTRAKGLLNSGSELEIGG